MRQAYLPGKETNSLGNLSSARMNWLYYSRNLDLKFNSLAQVDIDKKVHLKIKEI